MKRHRIGLLLVIIMYFFIPAHADVDQNYTVLNSSYYKNIFISARKKIRTLIIRSNSKHSLDTNAKIIYLTDQLRDIPYDQNDAIGEGDWQPSSPTYAGGAVHLNQLPVYRLDKLNCQSYIQLVLALLHSDSLNEFDSHILKISYGAADANQAEKVHYYNRNHFVDGDFNQVNHRNGFLKDVTATGDLAFYAQTLSINLSRQAWFDKHRETLASTILVLHANDGAAMLQHFLKDYSDLPFKHFQSQHLEITYLPKQSIAILQEDGSYKPNNNLLNAIPTPAIAEIISDPKKWYVKNKLIRDQTGTEFSVHHFGFLYRKNFRYGEVIYYKINCNYGTYGAKSCAVMPIKCQKNNCNELMFSHATKSHPFNFYWYKQANGDFVCTKQLPAKGVGFTYCNRVESIPLFAYLTEKQMQSYWYMNNPAILGVHIEKIL